MARRSVSYRRRPRQDPDDIRSQIGSGPPPPSSGGSTGGQYGRGRDERSGSRSRYTPLGVPEDYWALVGRDPASMRGMSPRAVEGWYGDRGGLNPRRQQPRYFDGDQYKPASSGRDSIISRQRALVLAGYLNEDFSLGRWDPATVDAYEMLLSEANMTGVDANTMLQMAAESIRVGGPGGGGRGGGGGGLGGGVMIDPNTGELITVTETFVPPPLEVTTTNKADLARVFRGAVREQLGQGWTEEQINELVNAYNWNEIKLQNDAYNQEVERMRQEFELGVSGVTGMGGEQPARQSITEVSAPSPETFLEDTLRRENPEQLEDYSGLQTLMEMISGWGAGSTFGG